jgi:prevent-host-death family protein
MALYGVAEAKDNLPSLIAKAEAGEQVIITRHGKPAVELKPVRQAPAQRDPEAVSAAYERLRQLRESLPRTAVTSLELKRLDQEEYDR